MHDQRIPVTATEKLEETFRAFFEVLSGSLGDPRVEPTDLRLAAGAALQVLNGEPVE